MVVGGDYFTSSHDCTSDRIILWLAVLFLQRQSEIKGLQPPFPNVCYPDGGIELEENLRSTVLFIALFPLSHYNFLSTVEFPGSRRGNTRIMCNKRNDGPWPVLQVNGQSLARHKQPYRDLWRRFSLLACLLRLEWIGFQSCPLFTGNKGSFDNQPHLDPHTYTFEVVRLKLGKPCNFYLWSK